MFGDRVVKVFLDRRSLLLQYIRGALLFYFCHFFGGLFVNFKRVTLERNVRYQSIRNFLADTEQSSILVKENSIIYEKARLEAMANGKIQIGRDSILGDIRISSRERITLGDRCLTSWNVLIQDFDPHPISRGLREQQMKKMTADFFPRYSTKIKSEPLDWHPPSNAIEIGDDVWIGANVSILKGAHIGSGCIIATGSVVTAGDYPPQSLVAGNPAKIIKQLPE